jgi:hypothetical protein
LLGFPAARSRWANARITGLQRMAAMVAMYSTQRTAVRPRPG